MGRFIICPRGQGRLTGLRPGPYPLSKFKESFVLQAIRSFRAWDLGWPSSRGVKEMLKVRV